MGFGQKPKQAAKVWSVAKRKLKTKDNCLTEMMMVLNCWAAKDGRCLQETKNLRDCVKAKVRRPARGFGGKKGDGKAGPVTRGGPIARRAVGNRGCAARVWRETRGRAADFRAKTDVSLLRYVSRARASRPCLPGSTGSCASTRSLAA